MTGDENRTAIEAQVTELRAALILKLENTAHAALTLEMADPAEFSEGLTLERVQGMRRRAVEDVQMLRRTPRERDDGVKESTTTENPASPLPLRVSPRIESAKASGRLLGHMREMGVPGDVVARVESRGPE